MMKNQNNLLSGNNIVKEVKHMAVMTQSQKSAFIVAADKTSNFIDSKKRYSQKSDYSTIIKQAEQVRKQIKKGSDTSGK